MKLRNVTHNHIVNLFSLLIMSFVHILFMFYKPSRINYGQGLKVPGMSELFEVLRNKNFINYLSYKIYGSKFFLFQNNVWPFLSFKLDQTNRFNVGILKKTTFYPISLAAWTLTPIYRALFPVSFPSHFCLLNFFNLSGCKMTMNM